MSRSYLNTEIDSMFDNEITDDALLSDKLLCHNDSLSFTSNELLWDLNDDDDDHNDVSQFYDSIIDKTKDQIDFDYFNDFSYLTEMATATVTACSDKATVKQEPAQSDSVSSACLTDDGSPSSSSTSSPVGRKVRKIPDDEPHSSPHHKRFKPAIKIDQNQSIIKRESVVQSQPSSRTVYKLSSAVSNGNIGNNSAVGRRDHPIIIANNNSNNNFNLYNNSNNHRSIVKINRPSSCHAGGVPLIVSGSVKSVSISKYPPGPPAASNSHNAPVAVRYSSPPMSMNNDPIDFLAGDYYDGELELFSVGNSANNNNNSNNNNGCNNSNSSSCHSNSNGGEFTFSGKTTSRSYSSSGHHNSNGVFNNGALFQTPIPQSGTLYLTEEERKTLIQENYPIPTRVPLTKQEERNLKKVRRKIKNKLSAQESRRKKKEYVDALEKKVEAYEQERIENKRRIEALENQQRSLQNQIRHYQNQYAHKITGTGNTTSTGLMLFMICFALLLVGGSVPSSYRKMNPPQSSLISSASLYYMGYGPSRSIINDSQNSIHHDNTRVKPPNHLIDQRMPSNTDTIIPRQSILLGEDSDDRNFEELVLSYTKPRNKICDSHYIIDSVRNSFSDTKNNDSSNLRKTILEDLVITRVSNINILK